VEGDRDAVQALDAAARRTELALTVERRDLARRPLRPDELARFDAAVIDPPRSGAEPQARALAESSVPIVVSVSCHPASFAHDAAILTSGGYRLERVAPIDQFLWSPHLEMVGVFRR
jgi:23S rRNA (uracil1939-C5)-methyltransferase